MIRFAARAAIVLTGALLLGSAGLGAAPGQAPTVLAAPNQQSEAAALAAALQGLNAFAAQAQLALSQSDFALARGAYAQFDQGWEVIEDGVRARSRDDYRSIEDAMAAVDRALRSDPPDVAQANASLTDLQNRVQAFIATLPTS